VFDADAILRVMAAGKRALAEGSQALITRAGVKTEDSVRLQPDRAGLETPSNRESLDH
jgi:hypothetical protein